jgi:PAS domain S-box-containing protein
MNQNSNWKCSSVGRFFLFLTLLASVVVYNCTAHAKDPENVASRTIRVVMDNNYPPYAFLNSEGRLQGVLVDQWQLWQKKTGIRVEIKAMDWASALKGMKAGEFDVIDTAFNTEERSGWLDFTKPYARIEVPAFFDHEIKGIHDIQSLKGFTVAVKEGDAAIDLLRSHGITNLVFFKEYEAIVQAAKEHKVNVFVVDKPPALYFLYKYGIQQHYNASPPLNVGEFHRAVKKGNIALLQEIEAGFAQLSTTELQQIETKWYGSPLLPPASAKKFLFGFGALCLLILVLFSWNRSLNNAVKNRTRELEAREEELRESESRYRGIIENIQDTFYRTDAQGAVIYMSPSGVRSLGYSSFQEIIGRPSASFWLHPEKRQEMLEILQRDGIVRDYEVVLVRKDGSPVDVSTTTSYYHGKDGQVLGVEGIIRDITYRKQAEEQLLAERQYLIDVIDFLPDATLVIDTDGQLVAWNRAAEAMTGVTKDALLGKGNYAYAVPFYGEPRPILIDLLNLSEQEIEISYSYVKRSGEKLFAEAFIPALNNGRDAYLLGVAAPLYDPYGTRTGAIEVIRDITELRLAEKEKFHLQEQLIQAQKMESIGRLAGGVAHDFNNMLGVILGYAELAQRKLDPSQPLFRNLEEIRKAAQRSADITQQLLAFARKQTVSPKVLNLNETVDGMLKMLRRLIGEDIQLKWHPENDLWPVCIDPSQVDQILANLCLNARGAIKDIGTITIETGHSIFDDAYCADHLDFTPGEYVHLTVSDNGCGIDKETLQHIFEPFFTTKAVGEGTGLGLATVYGAVKQNKGFINVYSQPQQGTTFTIYLPRYKDKLTGPVTAETAEVPGTQGNKTVLLVEDEPQILEMIMLMLESQGYLVLCAGSPGEAIRLAREHGGEIHLLMTDVVMPEMNGRDLAKNLLSLYPDIKRLFMSGYTANVIAHHGVLDAGVCFLQKPFSIQQMAIKIREALET